MDKYCILVNKNRKNFMKSVEGKVILPYWGIRYEADRTGYRITHIPTGRLLMPCAFATEDDAIKVANAFESVFGLLLDSTEHDLISKNYKNTKNGDLLYKTIQFVSQTNRKSPYTAKEIYEIIKGFKNA